MTYKKLRLTFDYCIFFTLLAFLTTLTYYSRSASQYDTKPEFKQNITSYTNKES